MVSLPHGPGPAATYFVSFFVPILATSSVAARFYVRSIRKMKLGNDDWTIFSGMVLMWALAAVIIAGTAQTLFGYHTAIDPVTEEEVITWKEGHNVRLTFWATLVQVFALGLIKLSVVLLYRRIFQVHRWFNIVSVVIAVFVVLWSLSFGISQVTQCGIRPWAFWTSPKAIAKYCDNTGAHDTTWAATDVLTDVVILAMPIPMILKLQVDVSQKIGIFIVFGLGFLSTAAAVVRLTITAISELDTSLGARDLLGLNTNIVIWNLVETGAAITAACLPTLRPLLQGYSPESVIGSIRSALSLNSQTRSGTNQGYSDAALRRNSIDLQSLRQGEIKSLPGSLSEARRQ